jgi:phosphoglycolate phosphatase
MSKVTRSRFFSHGNDWPHTQEIRMTRCLVLDLDGTLVDSAPDLAAALNRLMAARGLAPLGLSEVTTMVGDGVRVLLQRAFAARGTVPQEADYDAYAADYGAHFAVATRPFPGAEAALQALAASGWRFAVCTNKPEAMARDVLAATGLAPFIAAVGGGDSFPTRKPDPAHLLATLAAAGADPKRAVMIGDHRNDILAATGAGLPAVFAAWGYGPPTMADGAAAVAHRFSEVPGIVNGLRA